MMKKLLPALLALPATLLAHEGHGPAGAHWHATDVAGYVLLGIGAAAALWWAGRK